MRILLVSQFYPGPEDPDLGAFVAQGVRELERRGHVVRRAVIDRRAGSRARHLRLGRDAIGAAVRFHPDVVWSHFLFPAGAWAAAASLAARAPLVMTAHGQDVRNIGTVPGVRAATAAAIRRADTVIAVSDYLRRALVDEIPAARPKTEVIDSGVDLDRFAPGDQASARRRLGWAGDGPHFLFVGRLDDRKNVLRLADAFARLGRGTLALVGDGPLRSALAGRPGVRLVGPLPHDRVAEWLQAADVLCLPSTVEPFGQALLEALACERSVVATRVGGPPEFVTPEAGVLVDPGSVASISAGLRRAAELPSPNPAARQAAAEHGLPRQAGRVEAILRRAVDRHLRRV